MRKNLSEIKEFFNNSFESLLKDNYKDKILEIKRVTKVVKGGKKFKFRALVVSGDCKEKVGLGIGRAEDINIAIEKAILNARKNILFISLTPNKSIPFLINFSNGSCKIMLKPGAQGIGIRAGSSIRTILELSGIKNIIAKRFGSNSLLNNAKTTIMALNLLNKKIELSKKQCYRKKLFYNKYFN
jgi:small subunit ribosomal protein S5